MREMSKFFSILVFGLLSVGINVQAKPQAAQEPPPAQNPSPPQNAGAPQTPGRGERRPGVFGKVTAIHDQSIE
ncbi:MAG: hypothetical protein WBR10_13780, partial [Candidatus Acidiferrum sp.]